MEPKTRICFVCLGNIVRSPLAEHLFNHMAKERGVAYKYEARSAGCGAWHVGESPDPRMRQVAARHGVVYDGVACQFQRSDFERYDLILAMDLENKAHLVNIARTPAEREKVHLLREFDPRGGKDQSVPDPYYGGIDGFEKVYKIIERSLRGLLDHLETQG